MPVPFACLFHLRTHRPPRRSPVQSAARGSDGLVSKETQRAPRQNTFGLSPPRCKSRLHQHRAPNGTNGLDEAVGPLRRAGSQLEMRSSARRIPQPAALNLACSVSRRGISPTTGTCPHRPFAGPLKDRPSCLPVDLRYPGNAADLSVTQNDLFVWVDPAFGPKAGASFGHGCAPILGCSTRIGVRIGGIQRRSLPEVTATSMAAGRRVGLSRRLRGR